MNVCPILVGRAPQLGALVSALGAGGVFMVSGEAGVGKSRLLREAADAAEGLGHSVLWGRPELLSSPGPFSVVADLLDEASRMPALKTEARDILAAIDGSADPPPRQIAARIRGLLAMQDPRPVVMLEDLQDADELSLAVVGHLARVAVDDGVLMVGTHRPDSSPALGRVLDVIGRDRLAESIELRPLSDPEIREMLALMWGREPTGVEVFEITRQAEGIPFFIEELAASGSDRIPESVARAVRARMEQLGPDTQRVVQVACLVVGAIDPDLIAVVSGIEERAIAAHIVSAVRAGFIADREDRLVFRHGLMRQAVADGIVSVDRRDLHSRLAQQIEVRGLGAEQAPALARHYAEAGESAKAARWAVLAGQRALSVAAIEEARIHFAFACEAVGTGDVSRRAREGLSEIAARINPREQAEWEILAEEYEAERDLVSAARCWSRRAKVESWRMNDRGAEAFLLRARALLNPSLNRVELAGILVDLGKASRDRPSESEALLREGLDMARTLELRDVCADALIELGAACSSRGQIDLALELEAEGCAQALSAGSGPSIAQAFGKHAITLLYAGRGDDALASLDEAAAWATTHVGGSLATTIEAVRAYIYYWTGQPGSAELAAARLSASPHAHDLGSFARFYALLEREGETAAREYLDAWWDVLGGPAHRIACLEKPEETLETSPFSWSACLAEMLVAEAPDSLAEEWWVGVLDSFRRYYAHTAPAVRASVLVPAGRAATRTRGYDVLETLVREMESLVAEAPYPAYLACCAQLSGALHAARGDSAAAQQDLWQSAEQFHALGNAVEGSRSARAAMEHDDTWPDERLAFVRELHSLTLVVGAVRERALLEEAMRRQGVRPRAGRPRGRPRVPAGTLSAREEEVAILVAAGATNGEIARRLVISERTVEDHVGRAQRRLGIAGRAGLAAWAAKRGLV